MTEVPLDAYLVTVRPDAHDAGRTLVAAIDAAGIDFAAGAFSCRSGWLRPRMAERSSAQLEAIGAPGSGPSSSRSKPARMGGTSPG